MNKLHSPAKRGFTIVELLVIITTIGILAGIGIYGWSTVTKWSQNKQRTQELSQWKSTFDLYKSRFGVYPEPTGTLPFTFCLGNDFTGDKCGTNGSINENNDLMTQVAKVTKIPSISHPPVSSIYIGPYVTYSLTNITLYGVFNGTSSDCPPDTTFDSNLASGAALCKIVLSR